MAENSLKKGQYTRFSNKIGLYSANQENVGFIKKAICILGWDFYKSHLIFNLTNSNFAI